MPPTTAQTPDEYFAALPEGRREAVATVRDVVRRNLPVAFSRQTRATSGR